MTSPQSRSRSKAAPDGSGVPLRTGLLQRKCDCGNHTIAGSKCGGCSGKRETVLSRSAIGSDLRNGGHTVPPIVHEVLNSPGQLLDAATRAFMEPRFGHDFSRVRVHTDARAAESALGVNALAYTVGRDVVFGAQRYVPGTNAGRRLIAHELSHVIQSSGGEAVRPQEKLAVSRPGDAAELAADRIADAVLSGADLGEQSGTALSVAPTLQRTCADGRCEGCSGGRRDFWVTAFFRRRATTATMANLRTQINAAKAVLADCCLDLKFDFNWTLLRGPAVFPAPAGRPAGDPHGSLDYSPDAEALGEGPTFAGARGVPMLVVDDVPGSGGGVTMLPGLDSEYTGRNYFAIAVNQTAPNPACNHIAHELWHITGAARHDPAEGAITACTSNAVSLTYCNALRHMVAPVGDFPSPARARPGDARMA